jgi:1,4-dihydroxy-2-naphthoate octaprenyltransferase
MIGLLVAVRPLYLGGGLVLLAIGAALAGGPADWRRLGIGALVVVLVHVITHYVNDAEDVATDALASPTALTGGSRAIQRGLVTPAQLLRVSAVLAVIVALIGIAEIAAGDRLAGALHLLILLFGYAYSGRPFTLGRRGMSELDSALVMGLLVPLAGAEAAGGINVAAGAAAAILFVETVLARLCTAYPDLDADRETGKRTIPAMVGPRGSVVVFALMGAAIIAVGLALAPLLPAPGWQRARAIAVGAGALLGAAAMLSGLAARRRVVMPLLGVVVYAVSQAVLLGSALTR